jgi:hypothetical protein
MAKKTDYSERIALSTLNEGSAMQCKEWADYMKDATD